MNTAPAPVAGLANHTFLARHFFVYARTDQRTKAAESIPDCLLAQRQAERAEIVQTSIFEQKEPT